MPKRKPEDELEGAEASDEEPQQQASEHGESEQGKAPARLHSDHEVIAPPRFILR